MNNLTNIILITIDSLRFDALDNHLSELDAFSNLIKRGSYFTRAYSSAPYTVHSMVSLLTGLFSFRLKKVDIGEFDGVTIDKELTIASKLKQAGYKTIGIHSNPFLSNMLGFDKGFDTYLDYFPLRSWPIPRLTKRFLVKLVRLFQKQPYLIAPEINKRLFNILDKSNSDNPVFLWIHYMDTHGPYQSKGNNSYYNKFKAEALWHKAIKEPQELTPSDRKTLYNTYLEEISFLDKNISQLIDGLNHRNLLEDSLIFITADHGDAFGEHGFYSHPAMLYEELIRVPLIAIGPQIPQKRVEGLCSNISIAPTIIEILDMDNQIQFDEKSLLSVINNSGEKYVISFAEIYPEYHASIIKGSWKLIKNYGNDTVELFNIINDPKENHNIVKENQKIADELNEILKKIIENNSNPGSKKIGSIDPSIESRLRDLGYF